MNLRSVSGGALNGAPLQTSRVVMLCHTDAGDTFRVGSHHIARELARRSHEVLRVSLPNSALRRVVRSGSRSLTSITPFKRRTWRDEDRVMHLELDLPAPLGRGPRTIRNAMNLICAQTILRVLPWNPTQTTACIVDDPRFFGVCSLLPFYNFVYRPTDIQDHERTRAAERQMATISTAVVATSQFLLTSLPEEFLGLPTLVLSNGVDYHRFRAPTSVAERPMRVIYVGSLDDRFDLRAVITMSQDYPSVQFDIHGPLTPRIQDAQVCANLTFRGPAQYADIPRLLHGARVGLLPFNENPLNDGRSPMKLFEYLAAGLNVVGRRIPSIEASNLPNVFLYRDGSRTAAELGEALKLGVNWAGVTAAEGQDWSNRAERLLEFVRSCSTSVSAIGHPHSIQTEREWE